MTYESSEPCLGCGIFGKGKTTYHHIYSQKAFPEYKDADWNRASLCQNCHNQVHNKGETWMSMRYDKYHRFLVSNGWEYCQLMRRWVHAK